MSWFLILIAAVGAIVLFFTWANRYTAKAHARFQGGDVEAALTELVSPHSNDHDTWDLFLGWPIDDPYLESIRQRCLTIVRECPASHAREDMSQEGLNRVQALLDELRAKTRPHNGPAHSSTA
jgi:hypothetical protein